MCDNTAVRVLTKRSSELKVSTLSLSISHQVSSYSIIVHTECFLLEAVLYWNGDMRTFVLTAFYLSKVPSDNIRQIPFKLVF